MINAGGARMKLMFEIYDHILITEALVMELYKQKGLAKSDVAGLIEKFAEIRDVPENVRKSFLHNLDIIYEGTT